jgi:ribosomal protein S15P/S13E
LNDQRQDRRIFEEQISSLDQKKNLAKFPGEFLLEVGQSFLGAPYGSGPIETKGAEHLVANLREFDCFTFVENVVALAKHLKSGGKSFKAFRNLLQKVRYRQGRLHGYSSRLHYFSDWIYDNQKKGMIRDVTKGMGGRPLRKVLNFMTNHPELYPPLRDGVVLRRMKSVESAISKRTFFFIPKDSLRRIEDRICDGDLIAITTNREGLDVQHVGFAARVKNRIHLLHASSIEGKVVLSQKTLYRYLMLSRARTGMMVARIS